MKRGIPVIVAAALIATAFAAGYYARSNSPRADDLLGGQPVMAQPQPTPQPTPRDSSRNRQQQGEKGERAEVVGTLEVVRDRTLVVKVSQSRGVKLDPGGTLTAELGPTATLLREISLTELKKGSNISLRGTMVQGKFVITQVIVELR